MLKITINELPDGQRWCLQGRLVEQWASELRSAWREAQCGGDTRKRVVQLIDVTFIDRGGEHVLAEIMSDGAEFIASDVYTTHLLDDLRSALKRTRARKRKHEESDANH
jgi:hypothetical protein